MARDSNGNMTLAKPAFSAGTNIVSADVNSDLSDIATEITDSLSRSGKGGMTAPLRVADGAVGAPTLSFTSETGTGLYRAGAGDARMTVGGTAKSKWTSVGFFADVVTALTAVGISIKGAVADGASAVAAIIDNTIDLTTAGAKLLSLRRATVEKLYVDKDGLIDGPGALGLGTATGTTLTLGRSGQTTVLPGTVDAAVIDRAGTIGIGTTSGTTITVGRSGQTQALAGNATVAGTLGVTGTADIAVVDRAGTIGIGTTSGTTLTLGRSGQNIQIAGTVVAEDFSGSLTWATGWTGSNIIAKRSAGLVTLSFQATAGPTAAGWTTIVTLPANYRPSAGIFVVGWVVDSSAGLTYVANVIIGTNGVTGSTVYDNGTSLVTIFAVGTGDTLNVSVTFIL